MDGHPKATSSCGGVGVLSECMFQYAKSSLCPRLSCATAAYCSMDLLLLRMVFAAVFVLFHRVVLLQL